NNARRQSISALVSLAPYISVPDWRVRHHNDEVPDATPYGLHQLAPHGVVPVFAERSSGRTATFASKGAMRATGGLRFVEAWSDARYRRDISFDVTLCYDEWNGIPAQAVGSGRAPVMMGVHFLSEPEHTPAVLRTAARLVLPTAAMIFTHTHTMAEILTSRWGVSADRVRTVPFGIDTEFYALQEQPAVGGVVVSAGEDHLRDHPLLVEAMSKLKTKDPSVRLELATEMNIDVDPGLGCVYHERLNGRMRDLYKRASVVAVAVHPSRSRASGSTVVLE